MSDLRIEMAAVRQVGDATGCQTAGLAHTGQFLAILRK